MVAPDGVEWRVGRRWMVRRLGWSWRQRRHIAAESVGNLGSLPVPDHADLGEGLLLAVVGLAAALILIPVLFFGVELIVVGAVLAGGLLSHVVLRKPWLIEATSVDPVTTGRQLEWRVSGWRRSAKFIDQVVADLSAGRQPPDGTLPL